MSYKNTLPYFIFQSVKYAENLQHFKEIWGYYAPWKAALKPGRNSVADEQAWINFKALDYLNSYLQKSHKVFEYGGGGSTLFFAKRCAFVATVENDEAWFKILSETIAKTGFTGWEGFFQKGEPSTSQAPRSIAIPEDYKSAAKGEEGLSYEKYVNSIQKFPDQYFDVVLVDGRARPSCIATAVAKIKPGGLLVVDNMERPYYHTAFQERFAHLFEPVSMGLYPTLYHPDFTDTSIWRAK